MPSKHTKKYLVHLILDQLLGGTAKSVLNGNHLWTVQDDEIVFFLLINVRKNWTYRKWTEKEEPIHHDCPLSFLDIARETNPGWRDKVEKFHGKTGKKAVK